MNSSIPSESIVDIQRVLMFLLFLMFLLRKVPELDILRLGLHYIFAGCGLVELGNVKKNPGNVWKSFLTQMCKVPFIFCLFSLSLIFSSSYFLLLGCEFSQQFCTKLGQINRYGLVLHPLFTFGWCVV